MGILQFKKANCKNCYKCVRNCPVKAIRVVNQQAQILEEDCILCGRCTVVCPQNAKEDTSSLPDIQRLLAQGREVVAAVAPSFTAYFGTAVNPANLTRGAAFQSKLELVKAPEKELTELGKNMKLSMC